MFFNILLILITDALYVNCGNTNKDAILSYCVLESPNKVANIWRRIKYSSYFIKMTYERPIFLKWYSHDIYFTLDPLA